MIYLRQIIAVILIVGSANPAIAADSEDERQAGNKHRGAPPAALEACAALVEGDSCTFVGRRDKQIEGVCFAPTEEILACRPATPPPRLRRETIEAETQ